MNENTIAVVNTAEIVPFTASLGISEYLKSAEYINELKRHLKVVIPVDAEGIAKEVGDSILSNMVILGVGASVPNFPVEKEFIEEAIKESFKPQYVNLNIKAFNRGYEFGKENFK
jgi:indolepyruvate ferredoxin oxidoreductase beta subunit